MESKAFFRASDGTKLNYLDTGNGPVMLCINGFGASFEVMDPIIEILIKDFRFVELDPRGVGKSDFSELAGIPQAARDIEEFREFLGIDKMNILGTSMGALVALSYMSQFGCDHIDHVLLGDISPKPMNDDEWKLGMYQGWYTPELLAQDLEYMQTDYMRFQLGFLEQGLFPSYPAEKRVFSGTKEEIAERTSKRLGMDGQASEYHASIMHQIESTTDEQRNSNRMYWKSMHEVDYRDSLLDITCPVGIVYADPGSLFSPLDAYYLNDKIENSTMLPIYNTTHGSMGEQLDTYLGYVKEFCLTEKYSSEK